MPTARQLARRERILETARLLAAKGGLDTLQMRDVARGAGVSLSTLYRHHASKAHLVLALMTRELERLRQELADEPPPGDGPVPRVRHVLHHIAYTWAASPPAADAMLRAYLTAGPEAEELRRAAGQTLRELLVLAMWGPENDQRPGDQAVARTLETLLVGCLAGWASERATTEELLGDLDLTTRALLSSRS
ncbi:MAG TPA: TetR/AcrR family transcriptional regulator [Nitriliruptorales bacterium]